MNYSDIDGESNCLDQILIVIFVILISVNLFNYQKVNTQKEDLLKSIK